MLVLKSELMNLPRLKQQCILTLIVHKMNYEPRPKSASLIIPLESSSRFCGLQRERERRKLKQICI